MVMTLEAQIATRENVESIISTLKPICGGLWLVMDRSTHCHWVIEAATLHTARGVRYGKVAGNTGLATVSSRSGCPVFMIENQDKLTWLVPGETLIVQEGRFRGSSIVLQRLDDIDAPTISGESLERRMRMAEIIPAIRTRDNRYIEVAECLLPTGNIELDAEFKDIEETVKARMFLPGPSSGTSEALSQLERRLNVLAARLDLHSFVWFVALRETIARLKDATPRS